MIELTQSGVVLFGFEIYWYALLIVCGVIAAVLLAYLRDQRLGLKKDTTVDLALAVVPLGIICARIYYVLFSWDYYAAHPQEILSFRQGGLAIYGGVIGGALGAFIYCRVKKISLAAVADLIAPGLALAQGIGRWGNFVNNEAYGAQVTNAKWQFFPLAVEIPGEGWHWATFFYESAWCVIVAAVLLVAEKRKKFHRRGDTFLWYLLLYALERTLVEGLRTDSLYLMGMRVSQLLSLLAVLGVCICFALRDKGQPLLIRLVPVADAIFLTVSVALKLYGLSVVFALLLPGFAAMIYKRCNFIPDREEE